MKFVVIVLILTVALRVHALSVSEDTRDFTEYDPIRKFREFEEIIEVQEYEYVPERKGILLDGMVKLGKKVVDLPVRAIEFGRNVVKNLVGLGKKAAQAVFKMPVNVIKFDGGVSKGVMDIPAEALKVGAEFLEEIKNEKIRPMFFSGQKIRKVVLLETGTLILLSSLADGRSTDIDVEDYNDI